MPIYEMTEPGKPTPRMVKDKDVASALLLATGITIKAIGAERMIELQEQGVKLEKPTEPDPADPANYAPGGPLHGKTKPAALIAAEDEAARKAGAAGEKVDDQPVVDKKPGDAGKGAGKTEE